MNHPTTGKPYLLRAALLLMMVVAIITQTGCGDKEPVSKTDFCLNTTCDITLYDVGGKEGEQLLEEAFQEIRRYESLLSKTASGSDISNINEAGGRPVAVAEDTRAVVEAGLYMGELSGGLFDITVGRLTDLWDFAGENPHVPEQAEIAEALDTVDDGGVEVQGREIALTDPEAAIDLGGIAKGYIADRITDYLEERGVKRAIINLGGNVVALGEKAEDTPWNIGIQRPYSDRTELAGSVRAADATLVTSGIYERKFEENGVLYHHILDPATGYPAETDLESVTILAVKGNSGFCDGLSTVCLMLGKEKALALLEELQEQYPELGLEAALIDKNDDMVQTGGMKLEAAEE